MLFTHYYVQGVAPRERQQLLVSREYHTSLTTVLQLMSPLAPHITSQLWEGELTELYIYPWAVSYIYHEPSWCDTTRGSHPVPSCGIVRDRDQNLDRLKSGLDRACKPFLIV